MPPQSAIIAAFSVKIIDETLKIAALIIRKLTFRAEKAFPPAKNT